MANLLIENYYRELEKLIQYGGSRKETSIRTAFERLLNEYAKKRNLLLVPELDYKTSSATTVFPDGTLKDALRLDWGYWESKDTNDDLDKEIEKKFAKGYPSSNILFEDSRTAVLIQAGKEIARVEMRDANALDALLLAFVSYERPEVKSFRDAIEQVKQDLPSVSDTLRKLIQSVDSPNFKQAREQFFGLCKEVINPEITLDDINEMLIQHILTEDIFKSVYDESQYHEENNIALELKKLEDTFFTGTVKRNILDKIRPYYRLIQQQGQSIINHKEKKAFLNAVYEDFYKAYNPKMADRLGVVYTPQEIVDFMINSTEYLLDEHFDCTLSHEEVAILDPATGTGTFVCALIEHIDKKALPYKFENEIFANEVSILPYYIANLNIEYTYRQRMEEYKEFTNLCFVDTLDNIGSLKYAGKQTGFFGFSAENAERIKRQNKTPISVIIGNPPYNANQQNENDNNKNRTYRDIDGRIKDTYIKESTAQKTKVYDMYARFYRWATDRLDKNGVLAFITNRSFIDSRTFDGFRKTVAKEFQAIYIIDTMSDVRANPKIAGTTHNVFGIQTGVAVMLLVRDEKKKNERNAKIYYTALPDEMLKQDKLDWFSKIKFEGIAFERLLPDEKGNWLNLTDNDFDTLVPVCSKEAKAGKNTKSVFELFSNGVSTNRDEWVYDFNKENLEIKIKFFTQKYNEFLEKNDKSWNKIIKWSEYLKNGFISRRQLKFNNDLIVKSQYRPFCETFYYADKQMSDRLTQNHYEIFGKDIDKKNIIICIKKSNSSKEFYSLATDKIADLHYTGDTVCMPFSVYKSSNDRETRLDNITDWALDLFRTHYQDAQVGKQDIFHYVYAVLHNPAYRTKYEKNLKDDFPRVPLYADFWAWTQAGKALMELHLAYETVAPYPLTRHEAETKTKRAGKFDEERMRQQLFSESIAPPAPKTKLKAVKEAGEILIDEQTTLRGVPAEAWEYKLGNRSALEWVLDQYKESTPSDATIAEHFNTYRFADYKEQVIDLLMRVCAVSVETVRITQSLPK